MAISRTLHNQNLRQSMKVLQIVYLTILATSSPAASATVMKAATHPLESSFCLGPCSSQQPSKCRTGTEPSY
ncbi:hypothetical protein F4604DRAFT_1771161 [Suillus subluteus]|nr:hypothetical protein F4604DRAFT_1771161 [Suillus subluteus]